MTQVAVIRIEKARDTPKNEYELAMKVAGSVGRIAEISAQNAKAMLTSLEIHAPTMYTMSLLGRNETMTQAAGVSIADHCACRIRGHAPDLRATGPTIGCCLKRSMPCEWHGGFHRLAQGTPWKRIEASVPRHRSWP
jgi:hypothetical protein